MTQLLLIDNLDSLKVIRDMYRSDWPRHFLGHNTLDNFVGWFEADPKNPEDVKIFSLDERSWAERGLYLIVHGFHLFVNSLRDEDATLVDALQLLDWSNGGYKITSIPKAQHSVVIRALDALQINWSRGMMNVYRLPRVRIVMSLSQLNGQSVYGSRPLLESDAIRVDESWPSRQNGSLEFIRSLIKYNWNIGLYEVAKAEHHLIAWSISCQCGFLGMLHIEPAHRKIGLATFIVNSFAQQMAASGKDAFVLVQESNFESNSLFRKLNFDLLDNIYHIRAFS